MRARRSSFVAVCVLALVAGLVGLVPARAAAPAGVATPGLTAPPAGLRGHALWDSYYDLSPFGYEEQEYLVSGTATSLTGATAPYTTRIVVTRPTPASKRFNGSVVLDWVNVTAQFENAVDTMEAREMLMREGFAYVHVSAQSAGVCCTPLTPKVWDPVRYASLSHPGDEWSFDMFTQVANAVRAGAAGIAGVRRVIAVGQSQSGGRLYDYLNEWLPAHPEAAGMIDSFLVHGSAQGTKHFAQPLPAPVKVLHLLSDREADPSEATGDPNYRLWEVAGTAHSDLFIGWQSVAGHGPRVLTGAAKVDAAGYRAIIEEAGNYGERITPLMGACTVAGATMPTRYAASAAIHHLDRWARGGPTPANGPRFTFDAAGALAKDEHGNALGGIRLPPVDVPVARYESTTCNLGGTTIPFTDAQIQALYPTHAGYAAQMAARTKAAVKAGWMLPADADDLLRRVCLASVRWGQAPSGC